MRVETWAELVNVRRWARVAGKVLGQAPEVDPEPGTASGPESEVVEATLEEALAMPWVSAAAREPYLEAFLSGLQSIETALEAARTRQRALDLDEKLAGPSALGKVGPRPLASDGRDP